MVKRGILSLTAAVWMFLLSIGVQASAPTLLGREDGRWQVSDTEAWPYQAVCKLLIHYQNGAVGEGTGFIYGKNLLATAGHVLYDTAYGRGGEIESLTVIPGANGEEEPFGRLEVDRKNAQFFYPVQWKEGRDWRYDYGAVRFDAPLDSRIVPLEMDPGGVETSWELAGKEMTILGYDIYSRTLTGSSGLVTEVREYDLLYAIGIMPGESGAPVLDSCNRVVGIQNYGVNLGEDPLLSQLRYNSGALLSVEAYTFFKNLEDLQQK